MAGRDQLDHEGGALTVGDVGDVVQAHVVELVAAGHGNRILLSSNAIGVSFGKPDGEVSDLPYTHVLSTFVPLLTAQGLSDEAVHRILVDNPRGLLSVRLTRKDA